MVEDKTRTSQTLARGLQVLGCFQERGSELGIKELSQALELPQTIISRLVATFVDYGYLVQNPQTKKYTLGLTAFTLGLHATPEPQLRHVAYPYLEQLREMTKETVSLNVVDVASMDGVCIASIDSPAQIKLTTRVGSVRPLYRGATRKVLLAYLEPLQQEQVLLQLPEDVDRDELCAELNQIRHEGYAYSEEELDEGAYAVAAPVLTAQGKLIASVAMAGPVFRKTEETLKSAVDSVKKAASDISVALRGRQ